MNNENKIDLSIEMYEDLKETLVKAVKKRQSRRHGKRGSGECPDGTDRTADKDRRALAGPSHTVARTRTQPDQIARGAKPAEQAITDKYNSLLKQLAGRLRMINHENQHTHTLIEQVGQAVEALKRFRRPARAGASTYLYARHQILENISDDVRHAGMYFPADRGYLSDRKEQPTVSCERPGNTAT